MNVVPSNCIFFFIYAIPQILEGFDCLGIFQYQNRLLKPLFKQLVLNHADIGFTYLFLTASIELGGTEISSMPIAKKRCHFKV